jgi:hypothetical protein
MNDDDDSDDFNEAPNAPPSVSRIGRGRPRPYRTVTRSRTRDRFRRQRRQLPIAELIGVLIRHHGLTDECRQRFVCLYWDEIAGARLAPKTWPISFSERVLHVAAVSSSWVHELQFHKTTLIAQINAWVDANRVWLGPPPLVADLRFELGQKQRIPIVDREHVRRLRVRHLRRLWRPPVIVPPIASEEERQAIRAETSRVADVELRALIESVRIKWNR